MERQRDTGDAERSGHMESRDRQAYLEGCLQWRPLGEGRRRRVGVVGEAPSPWRPGVLGGLGRRVWALMGGRGRGRSRCACVHPVPSLGCWPGVPGAGDRCPASPHPPLEWGQLAQPPSASVRFQAVPWGNFDLERMRVTDLAAAQGRAMSPSPGLGCPCHLPAPGTPGCYLGLRGHGRGFSCFFSLPRSVHL